MCTVWLWCCLYALFWASQGTASKRGIPVSLIVVRRLPQFSILGCSPKWYSDSDNSSESLWISLRKEIPIVNDSRGASSTWPNLKQWKWIYQPPARAGTAMAQLGDSEGSKGIYPRNPGNMMWGAEGLWAKMANAISPPFRKFPQIPQWLV